MRISKCISVGLLALTLAALSRAATYYVNPATGSMSNNGTSAATPWSTLAAVFTAGKTFAAGDVILLYDGYHGSPTVTGTQTSGNVTIQAQSGHNPKLRNIIFNNASRWILSGLSISPRNVPTPEWMDAATMLVDIRTNCAYITIKNCDIFSATDVNGWVVADFSNRMGRGIYCDAPDCVIENNHIFKTQWMITIDDGAVRAVVRNNLIEDILSDGIRALADDSVYEFNTLKNWYGVHTDVDHHDDGFQSWTTASNPILSGVTIRGNLIINQTEAGRPWPDSTGWGPQGIVSFDGHISGFVVENNVVIIDMYHGICLMYSDNSRVVNNTVIKNAYNQMNRSPWITITQDKFGNAGAGNVMNNNLSSSVVSSTYAVVGTSQSNNILSISDPTVHFVDYAGYNFHLKAGSSAINAGTTSNAPTTDFDKAARTAPYDIGAFEYVVPLNAPFGLTATKQGYNQINLAWTDAASNETGFKIERKTGLSGSYAQIATVGASGGTGGTATYNDTSAGAGTQYYYRVRAYNAGGNSTYTSQADATTDEVTSGRIAHWKMDASSGTTAADSGGGNTGNLGSSPANPAWTSGRIGNGLDFDGVDDVVNAGSGATLDNLAAFSIGAWIRPDSLGEGGKGRIVVKGAGVNPTAGWHFHVSGTNQLEFRVDYATTDLSRLSAANSIAIGGWRHVVVTWTGSATATNVRIWVDGVEVAYSTTTNGTGTRVDDSASTLLIGNESGGTRTFDGIVDDVRLYNRVLSAAEIGAIYRANL